MSEAIAYAAFRALADGEWHSGEEIGQSLGVSRAAVSQSVALLAEAGVSIERARAKGYRLAQPVELLDPLKLKQLIAREANHRTGPSPELSVMGIVDSTNTRLAGADFIAQTPHALAAEWQTRGRGRLGRRWLAPPGDALTFSLSWRFDDGAAALAGLSLAVSVAVARALTDSGLGYAEGLRVKWPNDLLCHGAKLCGILIEAHGDMLGPTTVIVGVGINYRLHESARAAIDQAATSYVDAHAQPLTGMARPRLLGRNALLAKVIAQLSQALEDFARHGFLAFRDAWLHLHAHTGKSIRYVEAGQAHVGTALGVDQHGALIVESQGHTRVLTSAEVQSL